MNDLQKEPLYFSSSYFPSMILIIHALAYYLLIYFNLLVALYHT